MRDEMVDFPKFGHNCFWCQQRWAQYSIRVCPSAASIGGRYKCKFANAELRFLVHLITQQGIQPDPEKTAAIAKMPAPINVTELKHFLGMANHLGKFSSSLASISQPPWAAW